MNEIRTSVSHPLIVDHIDLSSHTQYKSLIGMSFCPGKRHRSEYGNYEWYRDLVADMAVIKSWGFDIWLNLMEDQDLKAVGFEPDVFCQTIKNEGFEYLRFPIVDGFIPNQTSDSIWQNQLSPYLFDNLKKGKKVFIHCRGGLGRTGLIAAKLMVDFGVSPQDAINITRKSRRGAIENSVQEQWVLG